MQNVLIRVAYDGTGFHGFQKQKNERTVQGELEQALGKLYGEEIKTTAAGRTDAGAHAREQAVNFQASPRLPVERVPRAANGLLPPDLVIWSSCLVPPDFNSRFEARGKVYSYTIDNAEFPQPLNRLYAWHCPDRLDLNKMQETAGMLEGTHDFKEFQASGSSAETTVRTIFQVKVKEIPACSLVQITVVGEGFLYKMVRFVAGALVRVGQHRLKPESVQEVLWGKSARKWEALPAKGLCLEKIFFNNSGLP